jgi:hypothetical protein
MSQDTNSQVIANINEADILCHPAGQVNWHHWKSSAPTIQQVCNGDINEQFLFCKPLPRIKRPRHC